MSQDSKKDRPGWILRDMDRLYAESKSWPEWKRKQLEERPATTTKSGPKPASKPSKT